MNLLEERWLPVRLQDGRQDRVSPHQLSDPGIAEFDACRADFNGALTQFAIGLLQTCAPVQSANEWRKLLLSPPDADTLAQWISPYRAAFEFDGDAARFMQDFELRTGDADALGIAGLLIDSPGGNAIRNNSDHFVKRGRVERICPDCAALALFTLQTNAPSGGVGHRTGVRGGGPLTTLLVASAGSGSSSSLWQSLWLNVQEQSYFQADGIDPAMELPQRTFPWLDRMDKIQSDTGATSPTQVHPAHVFWAMPRRIRLDLDAVSSGNCDLCHRASEHLISSYLTRNYGFNYKGPWCHPLTPYYEGKEGLLPLHPQPDGLGYRHWLAWTLGVQTDKRKVERASVVAHFLLHPQLEGKIGLGFRLWAFGYDMDNMKPRCWYDANVPLYGLGDCSPAEQKALREEIGSWLAGTELVASYLRGAVKDAWFSADPRGDFGFIDASLWSRTEREFYHLLGLRIDTARDGRDSDSIANADAWRIELRRVVLALFDEDFVGTGPVERQNPARIAAARRQLESSLSGPKLRGVLGLPLRLKTSAAAG